MRPPLLPLCLALLYLLGYLWAMRWIPWLGLFSPRGGIVGLGLYLLLALGLIVAGGDSGAPPRARFERNLAGWLLLSMPPLWCLVTRALL